MIKLTFEWLLDIAYFTVVAVVMLMAFKYVTQHNITIDLVSGVLLGAVITALVRELRPKPLTILNIGVAKHDDSAEDSEHSHKG